MKPLLPLALAALLAACAPHDMPCLDPHPYGCPEFDGADGPGEASDAGPADPGEPADPGDDSPGEPSEADGPSDSAGGSGDDPR